MPFESSAVRRGSSRSFKELQSAMDLESFWRANLKLLQSALPHHSCSLMLGIVDLEPREGRHFVAVQPEKDNIPVTSLSIAKPFLASHPQVKIYTYTDILQDDPHAQQRREDRERLFNGWNEFVHLAFWRGPRPEAVLSVRRSKEQGGFSREEREFLVSLHPVIDSGLRRLRAFEQERNLRMGMERFISGLPIPVMFLDAAGKLVFATQEAYDLCAVWNHGFKEARRVNCRNCFRVPDTIAQACVNLRNLSGRAATDSEPQSILINHEKIGHMMAKVEMTQPYHGLFAQPGFCVTLSCDHNVDGAGSEIKQEAVQHLQILTPSERRVALLVAEGLRNSDVARKLGKSSRTVDFQLNAIYRKFGVKSRTELARMLY